MIFKLNNCAIFTLFLGTVTNDVFVSGRPLFLQPTVPSPLAYYSLTDGSGSLLRESVSNDATAGHVNFDFDHQSHPHQHQPNWVEDEYFGTTIKCGKIVGDSEQKDTLRLKTADYGDSGNFAWSVWFRHDEQKFKDTTREQFLGHGDPMEVMTSRNQVHVQFETTGVVRTHLYDSQDTDRYTLKSSDPYCHTNQECRKPSLAWSDTKPHNYDDKKWHHLVLTTKSDSYKGYEVYIDSKLVSSSPYEGVGENLGFWDCSKYVNCKGVGGDPITPKGPIRLCGRAKPGNWDGDEAEDFAWDVQRYFHGQVAHFGIFDTSLSAEVVKDLYQSYTKAFKMPDHTRLKRTQFDPRVLAAIICSSIGGLAIIVVTIKYFKVPLPSVPSLPKKNEKEEFYSEELDNKDVVMT